jgi:parallel beta-helix repeat protein
MADINVILKQADRLIVTPEAAPLPNKLPLVNIGLDQTIKLPVSEITLTGNVSDSDGRVVSYKWEKMLGGAGTFSTPTAISTKVTGLVAGTYIFKLTITDDRGGIAADDKIVTVLVADPIVVPTPSKYLSLPLSPARDLTGQSNVIIENVRIENAPGIALKLHGSNNITIRNCFINKAALHGIAIENSTNINIYNNLIYGVESAVYALNSQTIKVNNNQFVNMRQRRKADGTGGGLGQFVQFNASGGAGCEIMNNRGENFFGESDPEDLINMFSSSGTAASPILIKGNMFRGGGPSTSGGGIIAGDNNGSYVTIDSNTLMNPGQYGIAIAGGHNNIITNNKIFSKQFSWSNIALYIWAQSGAFCSNNAIRGNRANWINRDGVQNLAWNAGNCTGTLWESPTTITEAEMAVPAHLINFITAEELLKIRGK